MAWTFVLMTRVLERGPFMLAAKSALDKRATLATPGLPKPSSVEMERKNEKICFLLV